VSTLGGLFVVDATNNAIRYVTSGGSTSCARLLTEMIEDLFTGIVTTVAGLKGASTAAVDGFGTSARLYNPTSIAIDTMANAFISDASGLRLMNSTGCSAVLCLS
jgi:hypothetical protein